MARLFDVGLESKDISILHIDFQQGMDNPRILLNVHSLDNLRGTKSTITARNLSQNGLKICPELSSVNHNARILTNESLTLYKKRLFSRILEFKRNRQY